MIADSPSQERGVAQRPPTAGASSKRTPSGSEVMSSACSPASRWCVRSISTAFGALRSNSLSLSASELTILVSFFQIVRDRPGFVYVCFREERCFGETGEIRLHQKICSSGRQPHHYRATTPRIPSSIHRRQRAIAPIPSPFLQRGTLERSW